MSILLEFTDLYILSLCPSSYQSSYLTKPRNSHLKSSIACGLYFGHLPLNLYHINKRANGRRKGQLSQPSLADFNNHQSHHSSFHRRHNTDRLGHSKALGPTRYGNQSSHLPLNPAFIFLSEYPRLSTDSYAIDLECEHTWLTIH